MIRTNRLTDGIVVPIDFSPASTAGLQHAVRMARRVGSSLVLIHVLEYVAPPSILGSADDETRAEVRKRNEHLRELGNLHAGSDVTVTTMVQVQARPYEAIVELHDSSARR